MSHVVLLISPEQITEMKSHYSSSLAAKTATRKYLFSETTPMYGDRL